MLLILCLYFRHYGDQKNKSFGENMKKIAHLIITPLIVFGTQTSTAALLTFDDVPGGSIQNDYGDMPTYQGFNFSSTLDWIDLVDSTWNYGAISGDFGLVNNDGGTGIVTEANNADFTFDGLYAKKWNTPVESGGTDLLTGLLSGYNNGELVWEVATGLNGSYEYYGAQTGAIDELRLGFGNTFLVDDITLSSAVPVPAAAWLFGSGLLALAGISRRKTDV